MELAPDFSFQPLPAVENAVLQPFPEVASPLGPLAGLAGKRSGRGSQTVLLNFNGLSWPHITVGTLRKA